MNIYDFDKTIYDGDSTVDFYLFCLRRHKKIALLFPSLVVAFVRYYIFKIGDKKQFKEKMYRFLTCCDTDKDLEDFWAMYDKKIQKWYLEQKKADDVIISASPQFLLDPMGKKFGFKVIASKVDKNTGKCVGPNCYHKEKVRQFYEIYADGEIDSFYSDHYSDEPLAQKSKQAFIVKGDKISDWDFTKSIKPNL